MKSGKLLIGSLVLTLTLGTTALAALSDGTIYNESFTGGTFDDSQSALANETGPLTQPHGLPSEAAHLSAGAEALEINNFPNNDGWLIVTLDNPIGGSGAGVVMEAVISVTKGAELSHHAHLLQPQRTDHEAIGLTIKAYEVDSNTWDLDIWQGDFAADSVRAGLSLAKSDAGQPIYYTVSQIILPGGLLCEVYVDDQLVGTYDFNRNRPGPAHDFSFLRIGNGHSSYGFYNALVSDVRIGNYIPEPVTMALLALGGLSLLRRRK